MPSKWLTHPRTSKTRRLHRFLRIEKYSSSATYSCKHKVTKNPICAIPCNGELELCDGDADEQCQGPGLAIVFSITLLFSALFLAPASLSIRKEQMKIHDLIELRDMENASNSFPFFELAFYQSRLDMRSAVDIAKEYYHDIEALVAHYKDKDEYLFYVIETNETASFFYDSLNEGLLIKLISRIYPCIQWFSNGPGLIRFIWEYIVSVVTLCLRYSDVAKDILLLYIIWLQLRNYESGTFPMCMFWILASSLIATEFANFLTILLEANILNYSFIRTALLLPVLPLIPAYLIYCQLQLKLKKLVMMSTIRTEQWAYQELNGVQKEMRNVDSLSSRLQNNENILENLTQLIIMVTIILLSYTSSRRVENIEYIFVDENRTFALILTVLPLMSLVKGQITYLKASKDGCLSGTLILVVYFLIGATSRFAKTISNYTET